MALEIKPYLRKAHYYETDQMGIIHHSNYIRWFEEARLDFLEQIGINYKQMEDNGIIIPVLSVNCEYKSMVRYNDNLIITPKLQNLTGVKFSISYTITDFDTNELKTIGQSSHCFLNKEHQPISIKRENKKIYDKLLSLKESN